MSATKTLYAYLELESATFEDLRMIINSMIRRGFIIKRVGANTVSIDCDPQKFAEEFGTRVRFVSAKKVDSGFIPAHWEAIDPVNVPDYLRGRVKSVIVSQPVRYGLDKS